MNHRKITLPRLCGTVLAAFVATSMISTSATAATGGQFVAHNTPSYVSTAKKIGAEDPSKTIEVSVWLNLHNQAAFDALARDLYNPSSPNYRHFLKRQQIAARFAPTAAEAKTVRHFFESHNLKVVRTGPDNFFVRARGTVGDVEKAFRVTLNNWQKGAFFPQTC